ncbi:TraY domain-containing protein [Mesorhizobium sp.]|uniref:TraY domain-containing protein n=1 Tax=Mesorhizobium sp. TaxID=1871066 RepID=UPI000FE857AE|nr:TraY domain-containing protein [Mesorhizobium sp.]RWN28897.1 MAG: hypothetical protein EOR95_22975 [Mesorhizobium sp.]
MENPKRRGRPTKPPVEGERIPLSLRVTAERKRELEAAATLSGRSLSQEAEYRLERSFADEGLFNSFDIRAWAVLYAHKFQSAGTEAATEKGHPEWTDKQWMADAECLERAAFAVMRPLLIECLARPETDVERTAMQIDALRSHGATYLANTGKVLFK